MNTASDTTVRGNACGGISLDTSVDNECNMGPLRASPQCHHIDTKKEPSEDKVMKNVNPQVGANLKVKNEEDTVLKKANPQVGAILNVKNEGGFKDKVLKGDPHVGANINVKNEEDKVLKTANSQVGANLNVKNEGDFKDKVLKDEPQVGANLSVKNEGDCKDKVLKLDPHIGANLNVRNEGDFRPLNQENRAHGVPTSENVCRVDPSQVSGDIGVIVGSQALNSSLVALQNYDSSESESHSDGGEDVQSVDSEDDEVECTGVGAIEASMERTRLDSSSSTSSSSTSSEDDDDGDNETEDDSDEEECEESASGSRMANVNAVKKTGAVKKSQDYEYEHPFLGADLSELTPVPDISTLRIEEALEYNEMGQIENIMKDLVMIDSIRGTPALDKETVLFVDTEGTPLGFIDDTIGNVEHPIYMVRFPSEEDLKQRNFTVGQRIYYAPKSSLTKFKGCDASWLNDTEVPNGCEDFSDDEKEFVAKHGKWPERRKRDSVSSSSSLERYKKFEQSMNMQNEVNTRIHRIRDNMVATRRVARRHRNRLITQPNTNGSFPVPVTALAVEVPIYNPAIPPPLAANLPRAVIPPHTVFNPVLPPPPPPFATLQPGPSMQAFIPPPSFGTPPPNAANSPWPNTPMMVCNPLVPPPMTSPHALFNTSTTFRPMAAISPIRSPNASSGYNAARSTVHSAPPPPPNFSVPPRMGVAYQLGPGQMPPSFPPLNVIGSTNMGTGGRYYDMWIPNQNPPAQWPYSMSYVGVNMPVTQPSPPTLHPQQSHSPQVLPPAISPSIHRPPSTQSPVRMRHPVRQTRQMQPITEQQRYQRPQQQHYHQSNNSIHQDPQRQSQPQPKQ